MTTSEWLSVGEFVKLTGLKRQYVYDACREGTIPCLRIKRRVLIRASVLDEMELDQLGIDLAAEEGERE
jgi:excisionase family DNA binding protein